MTDPIKAANTNPPFGATDLDAKFKAVAEASAVKINQLTADYENALRLEAQRKAEDAAAADSWAGQSDTRNTVLGDGLNLFARYTSGSANLATRAATGTLDVVSFLQSSGLSQKDYDAFNRHTQGKATAADMERLNRKHTQQMPFMPGDASAGVRPETLEMSTLDLFKQAAGARDISQKMTKAADISHIVDKTATNRMSEQLATESAADLASVTGVTDPSKDLHTRSVDAVKGLAGLLATAGKVAGDNPGAVLEYVAENVPQLLVGTAGVGGRATMTMGNIGYATQEYQKGIEKYRSENNGQLPPEEQRQKMALYAASAALAEEAGDVIGLGLGKFGAKAVDVADDVAKIGIKDAILNTTKAGVKGAAAEAATEGYQTFAEGQANGTPATAEQIYEGIVIGGLVGGTLSGSGRLAAEAAQATPEHDQQRELTEAKKADFRAAAEVGDTTAYLDPESPDYSRAKAVGVLFAHSQKADVAPEVREQNLEQAKQIVAEMESEREELANDLELARTGNNVLAQTQLEQVKAELETADPADVDRIAKLNEIAGMLEQDAAPVAPDPKKASSIELRLNKLDRELENAQLLSGDLSMQLQPQMDEVQVTAAIQQAATSPAAADDLIVLSMVSPDRMDPDEAKKLVEDKDNALSQEQRSYLRTFSEARLAQNKLATMEGVSRTVLHGNVKTRDLGISQYRQMLSSAIASGNAKAADRTIGMISKFAATHQGKADAARKAGMGGQIVFNKDKQAWEAHPAGTFGKVALTLNGGLTMNSLGLIQNIATEAKALNSTVAEMQQAAAMKFGKQTLTQNKTGVQSVPPANIPVDTSGSPASLFREMREREGRVDGMESEDSNPITLSPEVNTKEASKPANKLEAGRARNARQEQVVAAAMAANAEHRAKSGFPASPASVPASPSLADARGATAPSLASAQVSEVFENPVQKDQDTQPAAAQQQDERSESPAAEAATVGIGLAVFDKATPKGESRPYKQRNVIADHFVQDGGKKGATQRPLALVRDFLGKLKADPSLRSQFLKEDLSEAQEKLVSAFMALAGKWAPQITKNLVRIKNPDYRYRDLMQFFVTEDGDADVEENLKTAISFGAVEALESLYGEGRFNTPKQINAILGRDDDVAVTPEEFTLLAEAGTLENVLRNSWGRTVVEALGLKAKADAPANVKPALEAAMGAHVQKLLMDAGLLERTRIPRSTLNAFSSLAKRQDAGDTTKNDKQTVNFLRLVRMEDGKAKPLVEKLHETSKGTQGILAKLFSVESFVKEPSLEPIESTQTKAGDGRMDIPSKLQEVVEQKNKEANYLRQDLWNYVMGQVSRETALEMAGFVEVTPAMHKSRRKAQQAKNEGLEREYDNLRAFVEGTLKEDTAHPFYFLHDVWVQQRVGIKTNMVNPQASKLQRALVYRQSWETRVDLGDAAAVDNFKLRVAEGLGIKTDKMDKAKALESLQAKLKDPAIKGAVNVLRKSMAMTGLSENEQAVLAAGVKAGGEKYHSLDALMALAHYTEAVAGKKDSFTVQMMAEVDGVTNGPMLSHLLLGAAKDVDALYDLLNRGGFYAKGSNENQYNVWRSVAGHLDLYETTMGSVHRNLDSLIAQGKIDERQLAAVERLTGELVDEDGNVKKAGRDIIKTPLTALMFGSSPKSAVESMASKFVQSVYLAIEATAAGKAGALSHKDLMDNLNALGLKLDPGMSLEQLLETEFTDKQIQSVKNAMIYTLGKAVTTTMQEDFAVYLGQRNSLNVTAQLTFEVYNAVYSAEREKLLGELVAAGKVEVDGAGNPIHDLTTAQENELRKRIEALAPVMHTAMSQDSGELNAGLRMGSNSQVLSDKAMYTNEVHFGSPMPDNGAASALVRAYEQSGEGPGVRMASMSVHALDSMISHYAAKLQEVLNIHDAHGAGLGIIKQAAQNLNQAVWYATLHYSPATQAHNALMRTLRATHQYYRKTGMPDSVKQKLASIMVDYAERHDMTPDQVLGLQAVISKQMAFRADSIKLEALSKLEWIDQYAMEGGNYQVQETERKEARKLKDSLEESLSERDSKLLDEIEAQLKDAVEAEVKRRGAQKDSTAFETGTEAAASPFGEIGSPVIVSDPDVVALFKDGPVKAGKLMDSMRSMLAKAPDAQFSQRLLHLLAKTVSTDMDVMLVTPQTKETDVLAKAPKSRGWFAAKDGKEAVYLLSPEFKDSGLTMETLMHELSHAALARTIHKAEKTGKGAAFELVQELEQLRSLALAYVEQNKLSQFKPMLKDVHELVSWGMTNAEFQNRVLNNISMQSRNAGNRWLNGLQMFIETLVKLLHPNANEEFSNGMTVLVTNVSGLFHAATKRDADLDIVLSQQTIAAISNYTTLDIYEALDSHNGRRVSDGFDAHLRNLLDGIATKLHGPYGTLKADLMENQVLDEVGVFAEALRTGKAPFASSSLSAGFRFTEQEAFVLEQVEATVRVALEGNEGQTSSAHSELQRLYDEVESTLKVEDFHNGDWTKATPAEQAEAKALYDFVFTLEQGSDKRSDYLSRFAALGMAHEGFNKLLQVATARRKAPAGGSFGERLSAIIETVLGWFAGKLTNTFDGQQADQKLTALVNQLVEIEARRKRSLIKKATILTPLAGLVRDLSETAQAKIEKFGRSGFFQKSGSDIIKASGSLMSMVAGDRTAHIMDGFERMRDEMEGQQQGVIMASLNELRGSHDGNVMFHFLLRIAKRLEGLRKDIMAHTERVVKNSFADKGEYLSHEQEEAISAVFLRTDMSSLLQHYSMKELHALMIDRSKLEAAITGFEVKLQSSKFKHYYKRQAKALGYKMATGKATIHNLMLNSGNIARLYGTRYQSQVSDTEVAAMEPVIDALVSLYGLYYTKDVQLQNALDVLSKEMARNDGGNGVEMVLLTHKALQDKAREQLFKHSPTLFMKGYTPELYNPYKKLVAATEKEGAELKLQGYKKSVHALGMDPTYPQERKHLYTLADGGLKPWLSGTVSYTGMTAKGSPMHNGNLNVLSNTGLMNASEMAGVMHRQQPAIDNMFRDKDFDPTAVKDDFLVPVLNANGDKVNYRYMMQESTKDSVLDRDNRPDKILGSMAGSIFDKVSSEEQNARVVKALHLQYQLDYAENPRAYLEVGPTSADPQLREIYRMLPEHTKQAIRKVWGREGMKVRRDLIDLNFGYRKLSAADAWDKDHKNIMDQLVVMVAEAIWGGKAPLRVRQVEDVWQVLVQWTKSNLVVKSFSTLLGNFRSNVSQLLLMGVSPAEIIKHHRVALKGALAYRKDTAELFSLKHQLQTGYVRGSRNDLERQILKLEDAIARNPVRPLIEAGLMPTIVEDVAADDDIHSFKSKVVRNVDKVTKHLNPHVVGVGKFMLMTADSAPFKTLSYMTQISDFLARYTLYQAKTNGSSPMEKDEAIQLASDAFINYDIPTHRTVQYLNDTGFLMFTKYYMRIQKMLLRMYKDNPAMALAMVGAEMYLGDQPTVMDSSALQHIGNPFSMGALNYPGSLDELATVKVLMAPFK